MTSTCPNMGMALKPCAGLKPSTRFPATNRPLLSSRRPLCIASSSRITPRLCSSSSSSSRRDVSVHAVRKKRDAYLFEVPWDGNAAPQSFQTEQKMMARYNHLLKESRLMTSLRARERFERPRDKFQRERMERIEHAKWQKKQEAYVPEDLLSAGGDEQKLEEPFFDVFGFSDPNDPEHAEATAAAAALKQSMQQQLNYGHYANTPANILDLSQIMEGYTVDDANHLGGYMNQPVTAGAADYGGYANPGGYVNQGSMLYPMPMHPDAAAAVAGSSVDGFLNLGQMAAVGEGQQQQYWQQQQQQQLGQYTNPDPAASAGLGWQQQQQLVDQTYAAVSGLDWAAWLPTTAAGPVTNVGQQQGQLWQQQPQQLQVDPQQSLWPTYGAAYPPQQQQQQQQELDQLYQHYTELYQQQQQHPQQDAGVIAGQEAYAQQQQPWQDWQQQQPQGYEMQQQQQIDEMYAQYQQLLQGADTYMPSVAPPAAAPANGAVETYSQLFQQQQQQPLQQQAEVVQQAADLLEQTFPHSALPQQSAAAVNASASVPAAADVYAADVYAAVDTSSTSDTAGLPAASDEIEVPAPAAAAAVDAVPAQQLTPGAAQQHTLVQSTAEQQEVPAVAAASAASPQAASEEPSTQQQQPVAAEQAAAPVSAAPKPRTRNSKQSSRQQQPGSQPHQQPGTKPQQQRRQQQRAPTAATNGKKQPQQRPASSNGKQQQLEQQQQQQQTSTLSAAATAASIHEAQAALAASMEKLRALDALLTARGLAPLPQQQQQPVGMNGNSAAGDDAALNGAAAKPVNGNSKSTGGNNGRIRRLGTHGRASNGKSAAPANGNSAAAAAAAAERATTCNSDTRKLSKV